MAPEKASWQNSTIPATSAEPQQESETDGFAEIDRLVEEMEKALSGRVFLWEVLVRRWIPRLKRLAIEGRPLVWTAIDESGDAVPIYADDFCGPLHTVHDAIAGPQRETVRAIARDSGTGGWTIEYGLLEQIAQKMDASMETVESVIVALNGLGYVIVERLHGTPAAKETVLVETDADGFEEVVGFAPAAKDEECDHCGGVLDCDTCVERDRWKALNERIAQAVKQRQTDALEGQCALDEAYARIVELEKRVKELEAMVAPGPARMEIRQACRERRPLDGADAQALEHAITITEAERNLANARVKELEAHLSETFDELATESTTKAARILELEAALLETQKVMPNKTGDRIAELKQHHNTERDAILLFLAGRSEHFRRAKHRHIERNLNKIIEAIRQGEHQQ